MISVRKYAHELIADVNQAKHYQIWHTTQTIMKKSRKGTFCVDSEGRNFSDRAQLLRRQCDDWVQAGMPAPNKQDWLVSYQDSAGARFDLFHAETGGWVRGAAFGRARGS